MSDKKELLVAVGKQMRAAREKGVVIPFPSGNNYRVRNPGAAGLLKRGNLPNPLLRFTVDAFYTGVTQEKYDTFLAATAKQEEAQELLNSLKVVCQEMLMQPRVVDEPETDDEVTIEDVPLVDQFWAFRLCFSGSEVLYPFPVQQESDVERVVADENRPSTAKPKARDRR